MPYTEYHFGNCPICHQTDGYLNIRSTNIFVCDTHKLWWYGGIDILSSWRYEDASVWEQNRARLADYTFTEGTWLPPDAYAPPVPPMTAEEEADLQRQKDAYWAAEGGIPY